MTVGSALQSAAIRLVGQKPTSFFSSSGKLEIELCDLVNEVAQDIVKAHDWRSLTILAGANGDGVKEDHDLPTDYDRMPVKVHVWSTAWPSLFFTRAKDLDEWYHLKVFSTSGVPGWWIMLQDQLHIWPILPTGVQAQWYYISKNFGQNESGASIDRFTADTDTFKLPERLLTLGVIWRWRAQKRLEYAEDLKNYELALAKYITDDKGSNVITVGTQRIPATVNLPYPGNITT